VASVFASGLRGHRTTTPAQRHTLYLMQKYGLIGYTGGIRPNLRSIESCGFKP